MMNSILNSEDSSLKKAIEALVREYGALRVVGALVLRGVRRRERVMRLGQDALSDRLRKDIGLPTEQSAPKYWELR
jgi:hypothetical protein